MSFSDYARYDAIGLAELVRRREVTPAELLETAIARTEAGKPRINAVVHKTYDDARTTASAPLPDSPLSGVPFLIKDLTYVKDVPCTRGSRFFKDYVPDHDAEIVARYRAAGLVIFGKTNTPEVGLAATTEPALFGPCRNPWNPDYTPGGSSGGAAAAVAAGWLPAAHATDGGGSIRIPASCCGLVGLKPTRARTPLGPDVGEGWGGMASGHVVARSVRDSAAFLDATHGYAPGDPYCPTPFDGNYLRDHQQDPPQLRIALDATPMTGAPLHPACAAALERAVTLLEDLGHRVESAFPTIDRAAFGIATYTLVSANVAQTVDIRARALGREPGDGDLEPVTRAAVAAGRGLRAQDYAHSILEIHGAGRALATFMNRYDLILSPTLVSPPVPVGWLDPTQEDVARYNERFRAYWGFTNLYNATGQPAISLPLHWTDEGLPVGVQLAAAFGNELLLLRIARQIEAHIGGFNRIAAERPAAR